MHVSILEGSPAQISPLVARRTEVYLDGVMLRYCMEAHEEEGYALILDPIRASRGDHSLTRVTGTVTIKQLLH